MSLKTLVIKTGALGDLLVATAALQEIARSKACGPVDVLGSPLWTQVLYPSQWPEIQHIYTIDGDKLRCYRNDKISWVEQTGASAPAKIDEKTKTKTAAPSKVPLTLESLYAGYEMTVNLRYESFRFALGPYKAKVKHRVGSCPWYTSFLYNHRAPWLGQSPLIHERERNFQVISKYPQFQNFSKAWHGKTLPPLKEKDAAYTETLNRYRLEEKRYILVNPTASQKFKAWPAQRFGDVVVGLLAEGFNVRVIGSPTESAWLREVCPDVSLWVQPTTLYELMDVVSGAKAFFGNASSMHYIAAGFGIPTMVLMGAARPEVWAPLGKTSKFLKGNPNAPWKLKEKIPAENAAQKKEVLAFYSLPMDRVFASLMKMLRTLPP